MNKIRIGVIGLGYVGLPLAIEFGKFYDVIGFDISKSRINDLIKNIDINDEVSKQDFNKSKKIIFTNNQNKLKECNIYIITVPTPINKNKTPDLTLIKKASVLVSNFISKNDTIIFESTVFPGLTNDIIIPLIEKKSQLKINIDFFCGYSPERVNPGDKKRKLTNIKKIVSGSNKKTLDNIANLYKKIVKAGIHKVSSIEIAEAAKVIENCQRDINIAFVNELSMIFDKMNLDTNEILKAANTKWNFLNFRPGLVGGHCIGVDPYYLTFQAKKFGYNSKIILSGRKVNNEMGKFVVNKTVSILKANNFNIKKSNLLIMGFTFKENCPDIRNTKIYDIFIDAKKIFKTVDVYDPVANKIDVFKNYKFNLLSRPKKNHYDAIIILVNHNYFKKIGFDNILKLSKIKSIVYDFKNIFKLNKNIVLKNEYIAR